MDWFFYILMFAVVLAVFKKTDWFQGFPWSDNKFLNWPIAFINDLFGASTKTCPNCSEKVLESSNYCRHCGKKFN